MKNRAEIIAMGLTAKQRNYFRDYGATVAANAVVLGALPIIYNPYGATLDIGEFTVINSDNLTSFVTISSPVKFALGISARIQIGERCDLNGCSIAAYESVTIGNRVQIGPGGWISDTDLHSLDMETRRKQLSGATFDWKDVARVPVSIEDDVWIGASVLILKGVHIGEGSVVGAGSVVTNNVPEYCVVAGNPAIVVKNLAGKVR
jgi:acetyltransferase-like isoleucine patch superfamily enzyme